MVLSFGGILSWGRWWAIALVFGALARASSAHAAEERARNASLAPEIGGEVAIGFIGSGGEFARSLRSGISLGLTNAHAGFAITTVVTAFRSEMVPTESEEWLVTLDLGVKGHLTLLDGLARSAVGFGPSLLLRGAQADELTNAPGIFLDLRPLGVRFPLGAQSALVLDPLGVLLVAPRLSATPLVDVQFNTTLSLEVLP